MSPSCQEAMDSHQIWYWSRDHRRNHLQHFFGIQLMGLNLWAVKNYGCPLSKRVAINTVLLQLIIS